ncbi:MAG: RNA methyltransferase substrate-binding domain-containing protein, partial [Candidatus Competibacter sp.]
MKAVAEELIHGMHAVAAVLKYEPEQLRGLWVESQRRDARIQALLDEAADRGVPIRAVNRAELDRMSSGARHQGIVARLAVQQRTHDEADLLALLAAAG